MVSANCNIWLQYTAQNNKTRYNKI